MISATATGRHCTSIGGDSARRLPITKVSRWTRRVTRSARRLRRNIDADEVAAAAAYLLGPDSGGVTATTLYVDSGYHSMGM
jgi:enoyl-[acyl-carrier-protein] reductase (NADH)